MEFKNTQPLEEATPVVPETAGTIAPDEHREPAARGDEVPAEPPAAPAPDVEADDTDTYPETPDGSAGHP